MTCLITPVENQRCFNFLSLSSICIAVLFQLLTCRNLILVNGFEGSGDDNAIEDARRAQIMEERRRNISVTLKKMVEYPNYDKSLRPGAGGRPVNVQADMYALSIGPVVEIDMEYHLDVFFRQRWTDPRLAHRDSHYDILSLNTVMLESIWYPDTYFHNGKKSYDHSITTPNRLFRIGPNGTVLYTQRLTIVAECKMHFEKYPMDGQMCPLQFGSNSFSTDDIIYDWHPDKVEVSPDLRLSQFEFTHQDTEKIRLKSDRIGDRSVLVARFYLQRRLGYFMIQIYVPCILITVLSWVSFWLNPEATPARVALVSPWRDRRTPTQQHQTYRVGVSLIALMIVRPPFMTIPLPGVMTILTITTLGWSIRDSLPKVSYGKALDWYLALCFTFVLGSLVEFAAATYLTKKHHLAQEKIKAKRDEMQIQMMPISGYRKKTKYGGIYRSAPRTTTEVIYEEPADEEGCCDAMIHCLKGNAKYKNFSFSRNCNTFDTSKIDRICRRAFPMSFILLNFLYWIAYLD